MKTAQMYDGRWCPHHARATRPVGAPGTDDEREQCDGCEAEFQAAVTTLDAVPPQQRRSA